MPEYNAWRRQLDDNDDLNKHWTLKNYKGLGTRRSFQWTSEEKDGALLNMVFNRDRAAERRHWILSNYSPEAILLSSDDETMTTMYGDFINKELIHFSNADNVRSLPSIVDSEVEDRAAIYSADQTLGHGLSRQRGACI